MNKKRDVNIITGRDKEKVVVINNVQFKGKRRIDWGEVKQYLQRYIGDCYEIKNGGELIYIGNEFPEEFTESESRKALKGANAKAKANLSLGIPELIEIAKKAVHEENRKDKHRKRAKYGWYRYETRFALPVYENSELLRYNIFNAKLLVNHAENGRKYLYDILAIKKETSKPQQDVW